MPGYWRRPIARVYSYNLDLGENYYSPMKVRYRVFFYDEMYQAMYIVLGHNMKCNLGDITE